MKVGMLWYDDDKKRSLAAKVARAAAHYKGKYDATPNACYVHPSALEGVEVQENGVAILPAGNIRPNHFWIGVEEDGNGAVTHAFNAAPASAGVDMR